MTWVLDVPVVQVIVKERVFPERVGVVMEQFLVSLAGIL